eukprot:10394807-Alexandrium_andersonii.AAC.1
MGKPKRGGQAVQEAPGALSVDLARAFATVGRRAAAEATKALWPDLPPLTPTRRWATAAEGADGHFWGQRRGFHQSRPLPLAIFSFAPVDIQRQAVANRRAKAPASRLEEE